MRVFEIPILNHTTARDAVYDPFVGSGTTLIAGEKLGRAVYAMGRRPDLRGGRPATLGGLYEHEGHARLDGSTDARAEGLVRPKKTPVKARGGKGGYEPPAVRMRRDERILELALENRWSQRQIAAEVGLSQVGVHKALRRILRKHVAAVQQDVEAYRVKLLLLAERRARVARDGHTRSTEDLTTRRQRKTTGADGTAATTAELETHSLAREPAVPRGRAAVRRIRRPPARARSATGPASPSHVHVRRGRRRGRAPPDATSY